MDLALGSQRQLHQEVQLHAVPDVIWAQLNADICTVLDKQTEVEQKNDRGQHANSQ